MPAYRLTLACAVLCLCAVTAFGEDSPPPGPKPGHSSHGEVFNEGPRQAAYLMGNTGKIRFQIATQKPEVQQFFDQGLGQYYGFWYFESERSFRQMAALEPDNAMAYWGMALANFENVNRGKKFIEDAAKRKDKVSERERLHIEALDAYMKHDGGKAKERGENYARALEKLIYKYPDDLEAKALLALQLWRNRSSGSQIQSYLAIDALLGEVFQVEPMHSAHHFRIHLWDGEKTEKALGSAALCGQSAPNIAHMWHMSGHIFSGLKRYEDACWQQEASARVDHKHMMHDHLLPDQIHNFAHNNEWLIRDLTFVGRAHDAYELAKNMSELPRHPKYNSLNGGSNKFGRERLFEVLRLFEMWDEVLALADTPYLEPTDKADEQLKRLRLIGMAWYRKGNAEEGGKILAEVEQRWQNELATRDRKGQEAEQKARNDGKNEKEIEKAREDARKAAKGMVDQLEQAVHELQGYRAVQAGDFVTAHEQIQKAGNNVGKLYQCAVQFQAGHRDQALKQLAEQANSKQNETLPLAAQVEWLWKADKKEEAKGVFEKLRQTSGSIDLTVAPFARLTPIAVELGFGENWVVAKPTPADAGVRPPLDSLGPFRWQAPQAASWTLNDADGKAYTSTQFQKPVVLIFYLGHGCLHCTEQLKTFGPKVKEFQEAGIEVIAISSDDQAGLKQSIENYKDPIPFTLLSNSALDIFKAYRCHDDFENVALHGTFIIDTAGKDRWHDIGADPFMDADFVLREAKRLLAQKPAASPMPAAQASVGAQ